MSVEIERHDEGIALVTLSHAQALNALDDELVTDLRSALEGLGKDASCRVIVLAGAGRAFCAGLDLKAVLPDGAPPRSATEWMALQEHYAGLIPLLRHLPQPVIAAVQGVAAGAGLGLALAADIRIAGRSANFMIGAVRVGLSAGECGISYHLPRLIGAGRAFEVMLTGRPIDSEEALRIGLASELANDDALIVTALAMAQRIAANSPYAVKHSKQAMWQNLDAPSLDAALQLENHVQTVALMTADFAEAIDAFRAKRRPTFTGR